MERQDIQDAVLQIPQVAGWAEFSDVFLKAISHPRRDWELPAIAAHAIGKESEDLAPAGAAMICAQLSITLVDDILDEDPRGVHLLIGAGRTANIALALQAISFLLIDRLSLPAERRMAVIASLARMGVGTAFGQDLDVLNLPGEDNYWKVVQNKSRPFYGAALEVGGLVGGAAPDIAERLYAFGALIGEIIQIYDDLVDALARPANPDWKQGRANLAILYALTAPYAEHDRFRDLLPRIEDVNALQEAQSILIRSGAVSYCAYQVVGRYQAAQQILESLPLADPAPLRVLLANQLQPVRTLLEGVGARLPAGLELSGLS